MAKYKLKSKSGAKKRFSINKNGKVIAAQSGKQHGMRKKSKDAIRNLRGTTVLSKGDSNIVKSFLPYK